jgi:hypothetical protein
MPRREDHLSAARANEQLAAELLTSPSGLAWSPVLAFYAGLHLVDAYLALRNIHPQNHGSRRAQLDRDPDLRAIRNDYRLLERRSREARYDLIVFTPHEARALLDGELQRITVAIRSILDSTNP